MCNVPVIAICDSDCDPSLVLKVNFKVQYSIPANDDSETGLRLIASVLAEACKEGSMSSKVSNNKAYNNH
jgi:ribosomal protein S2